MNTELFKITDKNRHTKEAKDIIEKAGKILRSGGLVAFPTETVYGLGRDALNPESSRKIYEAKGRPSDNPLIVHICRWEDLSHVVKGMPDDKTALALIRAAKPHTCKVCAGGFGRKNRDDSGWRSGLYRSGIYDRRSDGGGAHHLKAGVYYKRDAFGNTGRGGD